MKKNLYILSLFIFLIFACSKKNTENVTISAEEDSITSYLSKANDFTATTATRKEYIEKATEIIQNQKNDSIQLLNLFRVANRYYNIKDWESYHKASIMVLKKAERVKDTSSIARAFSYIGDYYGAKGVSDTAFSFYFKAEKMYLKKSDNLSLAKTRLNKALLQFNESDFFGSEISALKALQALKGEKETEISFELFNLLGTVYNELEEYDKAITYDNKALTCLNTQTNPIEFQSEATSMNNLGLVYQTLNQNEMATSYFEKGLAHKTNLLKYKPFVYALLVDNLAYSRFKLGVAKELPELFFEALKIKDSLHLTNGVITSELRLSEYYTTKQDTKKSIYYSKLALKHARESQNNRNLLLPLQQLAHIEPQKATIYNKEYILINDSLQKADRNIADKFTRIEYETDKIIEENTALTERIKDLIYLFTIILVFGIFIYIIKNQKIKNRELLLEKENQKINETIYNLMIAQQSEVENTRTTEKKRVAQELHDGVLGRIFGIRMNLEGLNRHIDENAFDQRDSYLKELKLIEQDIREISHELSREKSELINNFVAIVNNLFEEQKRTYNTRFYYFIDASIDWEIVSNNCKINLYRIIQESLQNCNKYAEASVIKIVLKKTEEHLYLQISDNGVGFDVDKYTKGIGLQNMISRVNECKGLFEITSEKGEGTIIIIKVPNKK